MSRKSVPDAWLVVLVLALSSIVGGCVPTVAHGPRVIPGFSGGLTASYPFGPRYMQGDWGLMPFMFGPVGINLNHGLRSADPDGEATQLGLHIPAMAALTPAALILTQADLYYQLPSGFTGRNFDAGAGVSLSLGQVMPYMQLGAIGSDNTGWYTTQGVVVAWEQDFKMHAVAWVPTLAYQVTKGSTTSHFFVTAGLGKQFGECYEFLPCTPDEPRSLLNAGITLQFHRGR